ncbi:MAG: aldehyde-activating protein [Legionellales bacterium]|nr:MAG: aldehyde-activating protein [Legionellales bacterium]
MSKSNTIEATGNCLCGNVTLQAKALNTNVGACHCNMCRKWGGGPLLAVDCGSEVTFTGADNISIFDSSTWAERGFCKQCGTHLFYHLKQRDQYIIPADIFDGVQQLKFDHQIFIEEKPKYYCFSNSTTEMTGAEVFELFAED